jgi:superoxide reductase
MVKNKNEIYKCSVCGNIVETLHVGGGELVCCNKPMILQEENTQEAATEKHIPVIKKDGDKIIVKVGSINHPMDEDHYIEWIEVLIDNKILRKNLKPEDAPMAKFIINTEGDISARAYCNIHGLWKND